MMETSPQTIEKMIRDLLKTQNLAVLATQDGGQPYASLVAFAAGVDLKHMLFLTLRDTRKFANLTTNPRVALLVNSGANRADDFQRAVSVTAVGRASEAGAEERGLLLRSFLDKHPSLKDFAASPACALVVVAVCSFYLVANFQEVYTLEIRDA